METGLKTLVRSAGGLGDGTGATGVNKGTAALEWIGNRSPDFILGIGDDWTDEDLFRALPPTAFSVRVGMANTGARYYLGGHTAVRKALHELTQTIAATTI